MNKYEIQITENGVNLVRFEKVLTEDETTGELVEKEASKIVLNTPKEKYIEMLREYEPYPKSDRAKYIGSLSKVKLAKGKEMRSGVITPLFVVRKEFLKPLKDEDGSILYYLDVDGIPIQRAIVCGIVLEAECKTSRDGEY